MSLNLYSSLVADLIDDKRQDFVDSINIGQIQGDLCRDTVDDRLDYGFKTNDTEILDFIYKNALKLGTNIDELTEKYCIYFDATGLYDMEEDHYDVVGWAISKGIFPGDGKRYDIYGLLKANRPDIIKMLQPYILPNKTVYSEIAHYSNEEGEPDVVKRFIESLEDVGIVLNPTFARIASDLTNYREF